MSLTDFVRRPDRGGTAGRAITVRTNIFKVSLKSDLVAIQYDVVIDPEMPPVVTRPMWNEIENKLKTVVGVNKRFVYDGRKNAFSTSLTFPNEPVAFDLSFTKPGGQKPETFKIKIKKTAEIGFTQLISFLDSKNQMADSVLHAMTCLATVLRHETAINPDMCSVGSSFYSSKDTVPIANALEIWRGFHQSFRSMNGSLGLNVDISATTFRKGNVPLLDFCCEELGLRSPNEFSRVRDFSRQIAAALRGTMLVTIHRGVSIQKFRFGSLSTQPVSKVTFEGADGQQMNVATYFETNYRMKIHFPNLPCVMKANGKTGFPFEALSIAPGQRYDRKLSPQQTSDMIRATVIRPDKRATTIMDAVQKRMKYNENVWLKDFGVNISDKMMEVPARVLNPPELLFSNNKAISPQQGNWNINKVRLYECSRIASYAFLFLTRIDPREAEQVAATLIGKWSASGIAFMNSDRKPVVKVAQPSSEQSIVTAMRGAYADATSFYGKTCSLIFCIIDPKPAFVYKTIKSVSLIQGGFMTQCMLSKNVYKASAIKDQYAGNVALKINLKMGGITNILKNTMPLFDRPTMVCGADVTHAAPGSKESSLAAVVVSHDRYAAKYITYLALHPPRIEMITDMKAIMTKALQDFFKLNNKYPLRIVFYRDGVSQGQFKTVQEIEILAIRAALHDMRLESINLTYIIVQKRHHIRLFPQSSQQGDKSGNCMSGTVVDQQIVHPFEFEFVLQSHGGLQGTSRPCIYHVLTDDSKMTSDQLQRLSFDLCHLPGRATRTISMVAPAYRAHLAAYYGKMFVDGGGSDTASSVSGEPMGVLKPLHANVSHSAYYL